MVYLFYYSYQIYVCVFKNNIVSPPDAVKSEPDWAWFFFKIISFSGEGSEHSVNLLGPDTSSQEPTDVPKKRIGYSLALLPGSNCL